MATNQRRYILCPGCGGTGLLNWGTSPEENGSKVCPRCAQLMDDEHPLGALIVDGLRHCYDGVNIEIDTD